MKQSDQSIQQSRPGKHISPRVAVISILIVGACSLLPYLPNITDGFLHEDYLFCLHAQRSTFAIPAYFIPREGDIYFRPLGFAYFRLSYSLWQTNPVGYRVVHIMMYAAGCVILWLLLLKVTGEALFSTIAASLNALHPLSASKVLYLTDIFALMAVLLLFLALWLFCKARTSEKRRVFLYSLFMFVLLLGFLSKESIYLASGVVILLDLLLRPGRYEGLRRGVKSFVLWHAPHLLMTIGFVALRLFVTGGTEHLDKAVGQPLIFAHPDYFFYRYLPDIPEALLLPISRADFQATLSTRTLIWAVAGVGILLLAFIPRKRRLLALFGLASAILMVTPVLRLAGLLGSQGYYLLKAGRLFGAVIPGYVILLTIAALNMRLPRIGLTLGIILLLLTAGGYFFLDTMASRRYAESADLSGQLMSALADTGLPIEKDCTVYFHNWPQGYHKLLDPCHATVGVALYTGEGRSHISEGANLFRCDVAYVLYEGRRDNLEVVRDILGTHAKGRYFTDAPSDIAGKERDRLYFLVWNPGRAEFMDITEQMRSRIFDRPALELPDWSIKNSRDYLSEKRVQQGLDWDMRVDCEDYRFSPEDEVLYITPLDGKVVIVRKANKRISARDLDYLEIELSMLTRKRETDFRMTVVVEWMHPNGKGGVVREETKWLTSSWHYWNVFRIILAPGLLAAGDADIKKVHITLEGGRDEIGLKRITPKQIPSPISRD